MIFLYHPESGKKPNSDKEPHTEIRVMQAVTLRNLPHRSDPEGNNSTKVSRTRPSTQNRLSIA